MLENIISAKEYRENAKRSQVIDIATRLQSIFNLSCSTSSRIDLPQFITLLETEDLNPIIDPLIDKGYMVELHLNKVYSNGKSNIFDRMSIIVPMTDEPVDRSKAVIINDAPEFSMPNFGTPKLGAPNFGENPFMSMPNPFDTSFEPTVESFNSTQTIKPKEQVKTEQSNGGGSFVVSAE